MRGERGSVGQDPQEGEQLRAALHFVDHHQALQGDEGRHGLVQPGQAERVFEVEIARCIRGDKLPRQGGLAALARPQQRHHGAAPEGRLQLPGQCIAGQKGHVALKS